MPSHLLSPEWYLQFFPVPGSYFHFYHNLHNLRKKHWADDKIIRLRASIKKAAEVKLANGVISVTDLIREINSEDLARQTAATHRIQQLQSIYNYMYTTNEE